MNLDSQNCTKTLETSYTMVTAMQSEPGAIQVMATACLLVAAAEALHVDPRELMNIADRMLRDQEKAEVLNENRPAAAFKQYVQQYMVNRL